MTMNILIHNQNRSQFPKNCLIFLKNIGGKAFRATVKASKLVGETLKVVSITLYLEGCDVVKLLARPEVVRDSNLSMAPRNS
jgi:hypothetical protein